MKSACIRIVAAVAALSLLAAGSAAAGNWTRERAGGIRGDIYDIFALQDGLHAWCVWGHTLLRTVDGGATWQEIDVPLAEMEGLASTCFLDAQEGWAVTGYLGSILHTTDGGTNWQVQTVTGEWLEDVFFVDPLHGWSVGEYVVMRTTDGGQTWIKDPHFGWLPCRVRFFDALHGWMAGAGVARESWDGGVTWTARLYVAGGINGLSFADPLHGCVVGGTGNPSFNAIIYYTTDGGATWVGSAPAAPTLYDLSVDGTGRGYAVGDGGTIFATSDAGATWMAESSGLQNNLRTVCAHPTADWTGGQLGTLLQHTPVVVGWRRLAVPCNTFHDVATDDGLHALAVGDHGIVYATEDGGASWEERWVPGLGMLLTAVDMVGADHAWTSGHWTDGVFRSVDGGHHWDLVALPIPGHIKGVDFVDDANGWCIVQEGGIELQGRVCRSWNGGVDWQEQEAAASWTWLDLWAIDDQNAWVSGWEPATGVLAHTTDGGATWTKVYPPTAEAIWAIAFPSLQEGWIADESGAVFHTVDGGTSWDLVHQGPAGTAWLDLAPVARWGIAVAGARQQSGSTVGEVDMSGGQEAAWQKSLEVFESHLLGLDFTTLQHGYAVGVWGEVWLWHPSTSETEAVPLPAALRLAVTRNPARGGAVFDLQVPAAVVAAGRGATALRVEVIDVRGRRVRELVAPIASAGRQTLQWDGTTASTTPAPAGVYFARAHGGGQEAAVRFVLLR